MVYHIQPMVERVVAEEDIDSGAKLGYGRPINQEVGVLTDPNTVCNIIKTLYHGLGD